MEYNLSGKVTISVSTRVEANSLDEAIEIAEGREIESYQWGQEELDKIVWISSEFDGEVFDIEND